uniref:hypothetical protein n=1 Tax=Methanobrevibacter sp. TaxID=66852 RepID=UPI0038644ADC
MKNTRSLLFILILFLIIFSTSFVSANDDLTHTDTNGDALSVPDQSAIDENSLNEINLDSIEQSSDSASDLVDDAQNTDEIEDDGCLTYNEKAPVLGVSNDEPILGVSNDEPVLGATINLYGGTAQSVVDAILNANPGDIIYLNGGTYTGAGKTKDFQWWEGHSNNYPFNLGRYQTKTISNIKVIGGSERDPDQMATFQPDNDQVALTFSGYSEGIPDQYTSWGSQRQGYFSTSGYIFENVTFENLATTERLFSFNGGSLTNCVFNNMDCSEHLFFVTGCYFDKGTINLTNCNFTNCHQTFAGIEGVDDGTGQLGAVWGAKMVGCNFINTSSAHHGGAFCLSDESEWGSARVASSLIDCNFINITSRWFAVYIHGNFSTSFAYIDQPQLIQNCKFINCNSTSEYGGAVGISHNNVIIKDSEFINNTGGQGSAIMVGGIDPFHEGFWGRNTQGNNVTIDNCTFAGNVAKVEGQNSSFSHAVYKQMDEKYDGQPRFDYNEWTGQYTPNPYGNYYMKHDGITFYPQGDAGAVYVFGNDTKILNSVFYENSASNDGAAIYIQGDRTIINNTEFFNHESETGTVFINGNYTKIIDSTFRDNEAIEGAGIHIVGHDTNITGSTFRDNYAVEGAGVYIEGNDTVISDSTFETNEAINGAGAYVIGSNTEISDSQFNENEATFGGAGVYIEGNDAVISGTSFEDNEAEYGGGAYIEGNNTKIISDSNFDSNNATDGGAVYIKGSSSEISDSTFNENIVPNHGGAVYIEGSGTEISSNTFTNNEAVPESAEGTDGLGGAIYVKGNNTTTDSNEFTHNKARNGSAIYTDGNNFVLTGDVFNENQAWSYLLIVTPRPEDSYYNTSDVNITVCHVGGDNIINAIHNTADNDQITFNHVTYKHSSGSIETTGDNQHPVGSAEESQGGTLVYQDDREYLQVVNITEILDEKGHNILADYGYPNGYVALTNLTGEIRLTLKKPIKKGTYTVYAKHPEDWNYKEISNTTEFRIYEANITIEKINLNSTDFVVINDTVAFKITVNNTGEWFITNITVNDIFNASELEYIGHSNNKTWNLTGNNTGNLTFSFNNTGMGAGDIYAYEINVTNTGSSALTNVTLGDIFDANKMKYVTHSDLKEWIYTIKTEDKFLLNGTLGAGDSRVLKIWLKNLVEGNLTINNPVVNQANVAVETKLLNNSYPLHAKEVTSLIIWFKAKTNGTLFNNVTVKSNEANETNSTANVTVYSPNMTVEKVSLNKTDFVVVNDTVAFNITVTNTGDSWLSNVTVEDLFNSS